MECRACERRDSKRNFYCSTCVTTRCAARGASPATSANSFDPNRVNEHYARRQQLKGTLVLARAKAGGLLVPPPGSGVLGVREESELKAEKWTLAVRLRDVRAVAEKERESIAAGASLSSWGGPRGADVRSTDRTSFSERHVALSKRRANLNTARTLLSDLSSPTRPTPTRPLPDALASLEASHVLLLRQHQELLQRTEATQLILTRELLSVFAFSPTSASLPSPFTSPSSSTSSTSSLCPTYTLSTLSLPSLTTLPLLSSPVLSATLSHLLHLTRLLALYFSLSLPFTPLPSLFGPGRPGVCASPGWGDGTFPLFPSRATGGATKDFSGGGEQSGGRELEGAMREKERREERMKAVVGGSVALAFDLAYLAWRRGGEVREDELGDLGALVLKASGVGGGDQR